MPKRSALCGGLFALLVCMGATPAAAQVVITQAKALAGGVVPGDAAGFPVEIAVPGSYRLGSNLDVTTGRQDAIRVSVPDVTIDLNGFSIDGKGSGRYGIVAYGEALTVLNGSIHNFTYDAIYHSGSMLRAEGLRLSDNGRYGINELFVNASPKTGKEDGTTLIRNNIITRNLQGITCQASCNVIGNTISYNTYSAIVISQSGGSVTGNIIANNGGYGVVGNYIGLGGNTIFSNGYCHTSGLMAVMEKNAITPESAGASCPALPGN